MVLLRRPGSTTTSKLPLLVTILTYHDANNSFRTSYKSALKSGLYDFTSARDFYREVTKAAGIGMHADLARRYIELQALMLTVIAPHWAEHVWLEVLGHKESVQHARFPTVPNTDAALTAAREYVRNTTSSITSAEGAQMKRMAKGKATSYDPKKPKLLTIYAALKYPEWQEQYIDLMREKFDGMNLDMKELSKNIDKKDSKRAMPFIQCLKRSIDSGIPKDVVFERKLAFDEEEILAEMLPGLRQTIVKCVAVEVVLIDQGGKSGKVVASIGQNAAAKGAEKTNLPPAAEGAVPGTPTFFFENAAEEAS